MFNGRWRVTVTSLLLNIYKSTKSIKRYFTKRQELWTAWEAGDIPEVGIKTLKHFSTCTLSLMSNIIINAHVTRDE